ncbi:Aggrecan core protein [Melipona quadrifasciata]|uniref:Aggrecan core protein n=1 Tax=Melipona quadrifasciata TaxID=166423 RepID=A0A0M8ZX76_9HYME|nr:Aggrecan core protein [Melipona quadrifasciata]
MVYDIQFLGSTHGAIVQLVCLMSVYSREQLRNQTVVGTMSSCRTVNVVILAFLRKTMLELQRNFVKKRTAFCTDSEELLWKSGSLMKALVMLQCLSISTWKLQDIIIVSDFIGGNPENWASSVRTIVKIRHSEDEISYPKRFHFKYDVDKWRTKSYCTLMLTLTCYILLHQGWAQKFHDRKKWLERLLIGEIYSENNNDPLPTKSTDKQEESANIFQLKAKVLKEEKYYDYYVEGEKIVHFQQANWYRASQYCRYHGMHLASIASQEENDRLEKHIKDFGLGHEHFWTSGTDQAEEGTFFWMANGRPITFENWNVGEPNNFRYENGEEEHCLELWNRDGKGLKWNDSPCSFETFFVCECKNVEAKQIFEIKFENSIQTRLKT